MAWVRGAVVGRGSFGTVNLALAVPTTKEGDPAGNNGRPEVMAVKSSLLAESATLSHEKEVLDRLAGCPDIVGCYGDGVSVEADGRRLYNVFLEYVPGGSLSDLCRGKPVAEADVRRYAASMLRGLRGIHGAGYVHCDLKPQNVLVAGAWRAKIADFGLAKRAGAKVGGGGRTGFLRGTLLYMAPESLERGEYEPPSDIWSLACVVSEMATGVPAWRYRGAANAAALLLRISSDEESPEIPDELSEEGKDFLRRCFVREPRERWTAEMLLRHPFVAAATEDDHGADDAYPGSGGGQPAAPLSPRSIMGFPNGASPHPSYLSFSAATAPEPCCFEEGHLHPPGRLQQLITMIRPPLPEQNSSSSSEEENLWLLVRRREPSLLG